MKQFNIKKTPIMDLKVIEYVSSLDEHGFFKKMFSQKKLENLVGNKTIKRLSRMEFFTPR